MALNVFSRHEYIMQWLNRAKNTMDICGLSYMWYNQHTIPTKQCKPITIAHWTTGTPTVNKTSDVIGIDSSSTVCSVTILIIHSRNNNIQLKNKQRNAHI